MAMANGKELRNIIFMVVTIVLAFTVSITSIMGGDIIGIVISIMLLGMLCIGLGYLYCKNEDKLFAAHDKGVMPKVVVVAEEKAKKAEDEEVREDDSEKCAD